MAVGRVKQNLWRESWVGAIATVGDPLGRAAAAGWPAPTSPTRRRASAATRTSWSASGGSRRAATDLGGDSTAHGFKIDYPERPVGHRAHLQAHRPRLRSVARIRAAAGGAPRTTCRPTTARASRAGRSSSCSTSSEPFVATDLVGPVGELSRVHRADQLAVSQRRPRRVQRQPDGRAARRRRSRSPTASSFAPGSYHWRRYRLEAGTAQKRRLYTQVTWWFGGFYDGDARSVHLDRRLEPDAARHRRVLRRAQRRPPRRRATSRRRSSAPALRRQRLAGPVGRQLRAVRHRQRLGRHQHAAALDVHAGRRPVRRLQPQRAVARSIAGSSTRISCWSSCSTRGAILIRGGGVIETGELRKSSSAANAVLNP